MKTIANPKTQGKFSRKALHRTPTETIHYYESQGLAITGSGKWVKALCPFHNDTQPSLGINTETGGYNCLACGARGGDILAFHMHHHSMGFIDAAKAVGAWVGG